MLFKQKFRIIKKVQFLIKNETKKLFKKYYTIFFLIIKFIIKLLNYKMNKHKTYNFFLLYKFIKNI